MHWVAAHARNVAARTASHVRPLHAAIQQSTVLAHALLHLLRCARFDQRVGKGPIHAVKGAAL